MLLSQQEFEKLNKYKNKPAISLFIPTARAGKEVHNEKNKTHLKSQWDQIKREDSISKFSDDQLKKHEEKINALLADKDFWHHQADGLAIFMGEDFFEYYRLPIPFKAYHHISHDFYLKPIVPMFSDESPFYLLSLQLEDVNLYEANQHSIRKLKIEDLTPTRLEERVGYDYKEKNLQFRNIADGQGNTQYHGHGGGERNDEAEVKNYLSAIDNGLQKFLNDKKAPLVVMCQEDLFPIYKETNSYAHLYEKPVAENPADMKVLEMHQEASKVLEDYFEQNRRGKLDEYKETDPQTKSAVVRDIVPAAYEGKIDTLFLQNSEEIWGTYDEESTQVKIHNERQEDSISLMNLTVKKVLETDGRVFLIKRAFMPESESKMNALYRY